jgi:hypothetical protein
MLLSRVVSLCCASLKKKKKKNNHLLMHLVLDLNYRIDLPREKVIEAVQRQDWPYLLVGSCLLLCV